MVLDIALGLVLGVLILALIPIVVIGSIAAFRWLVPIAVAAVSVGLMVQFPRQALGTVGVVAVVLALVVGWALLPGKLSRANGRVAHGLAAIHSKYFALLDNRDPYKGFKWLPLRLAAGFLAIVAVGTLAAAALAALDALWHAGA